MAALLGRNLVTFDPFAVNWLEREHLPERQQQTAATTSPSCVCGCPTSAS
jgi:hypothetical protein